MADISIIEYLFFAFFSYSSMAMLIISVIKNDVPITRALMLVRVIYLIPGMIFSAVLASSGPNINWPTETVTTLTKDLNSSTVWSESATHMNQLSLSSPVWQMGHMLLMLVLLVYIIQQITIFMTSKE